MGFDYKKAKQYGYSDTEISSELKRRGVVMDVNKASKVGYGSDEIADEISRRFDELKPKKGMIETAVDAVEEFAKDPIGNIIGKRDNSKNFQDSKPTPTAMPQQITPTPTPVKPKSNTPWDNLMESPVKIDTSMIDANTPEKMKKLIDEKEAAKTKKHDDLNRVLGDAPIEDATLDTAFVLGGGLHAAKGVGSMAVGAATKSKPLIEEGAKAYAKGGTFAVGDAAGQVGAEIGIEGSDALMTDEFKKNNPKTAEAIKMAAGLVLGGVAGYKAEANALRNAEINPLLPNADDITKPKSDTTVKPSTTIEEIPHATIENDMAISDSIREHLHSVKTQSQKELDIAVKGFEDLTDELYGGVDAPTQLKPKGADDIAGNIQEDGRKVIPNEDYDALRNNLLKHEDEANVDEILSSKFVRGTSDDAQANTIQEPIETTQPIIEKPIIGQPEPEAVVKDSLTSGNDTNVATIKQPVDYVALSDELKTTPPDPYTIKALEVLDPLGEGRIFAQNTIRNLQEGGDKITHITAQKYDDAMEAAGRDTVEAKALELRQADEARAGEIEARKAQIAQKETLKADMETITAHPRLQELVDMRREVSAKESLSPNARVQDRQFIGDEANPTVIGAIDEKNYNHDFTLTKADIKAYESGKITPKLAEKFKRDLDVLDNDPKWQKAEDGSGKVVGDKFIDEMGNEMDIPFSRANRGAGVVYGKGFTSSHIKEVKIANAGFNGEDATQYRFINPVKLKDGSRISGFNDKDFKVLVGYEKNGEPFTIDTKRFDPEQIDFTAKEKNSKAQDTANRLYDYAKIGLSKGEPVSSPHNAETMTQSISSALGKTVSEKLSPTMSVILKADIPEAVLAKAKGDIEGIHGFVHEGKAYIVADNIPKGWSNARVRGLVMHEVGVHLRKVGADDKNFTRILDAMKKSKDPSVIKAYERVPNDTPRHLIDEEALAYLIQNHPQNGFVKSVVAWVKNQLIKMGVSPSLLKLTPSDLSAMAWGAVKRNDNATFGIDTMFHAALKMGKNPHATIEDVKESLSIYRGEYENIDYTKENWNNLFPDNMVKTPLGDMKLGDNQFEKLDPNTPDPKNPDRIKQDRRHHLSYIHQTLTDPALAIEKRSGETLFIKEFNTDKGVRQYTSITINKGDLKVSISSYGMDYKQILKEANAGKIVYLPSEVTPNGAAISVSHPTSDFAVKEIVPQQKSQSQDVKFSKLQDPKISLHQDRVAAAKAVKEWGESVKDQNTNRKNMFTMNKNYEKEIQTKHHLVSEALDHATILHKTMEKLSPRANQLLQRYIVKDISEIEPEFKFLEKLGDDINEYIGKMSDELHALGMLDKETLEMYKGKYLHRLYEEHWFDTKRGKDAEAKKLPAMYQRGKQLETADASEAYKYLNDFGVQKQLEPLDPLNSNMTEVLEDARIKGYFGNKIDGMVWVEFKDGKFVFDRDWTKAEREAMGEIENAAITVPNTIARLANELETAKMFKRLSNDADVVYRGTETDEGKIREMGFERIEFNKRYGALSGKFVDKRVHDDLTHMNNMGDAMRGWLKALSLWKQSKTVWNVSAHFNNFTSNIMLRFLAGDTNPFANMVEAHRQMGVYDDVEKLMVKKMSGKATPEDVSMMLKLQKDNPFIMEARKIGLFGKSEINDILQGYSGSSVFNNRKGAFGKVNDFAQKMYSGEDAIVRMAMYISRREKGTPVLQAQREIEAILPDYTRPLPVRIRNLRNSGVAPFISWSYYVLPNIVRLAGNNKWRAAAVLGAPMVLSEVAMQMQGQSNADLPTDAVGRRLGYNVDDNGYIDTVKIDRILPGFDIASIPLSAVMSAVKGYEESGEIGHTLWEGLKGGVGGAVNFATSIGSGPTTNAFISPFTKSDIYTGRPIVGNANQSDLQEVANIGRFMMDKFVPVPLQAMSTYDFAQGQLKDQEDRKKFQDIVPRTTAQQMVRLFPGVNTLTYDPDVTEKQLERKRKKYENIGE